MKYLGRDSVGYTYHYDPRDGEVYRYWQGIRRDYVCSFRTWARFAARILVGAA